MLHRDYWWILVFSMIDLMNKSAAFVNQKTKFNQLFCQFDTRILPHSISNQFTITLYGFKDSTDLKFGILLLMYIIQYYFCNPLDIVYNCIINMHHYMMYKYSSYRCYITVIDLLISVLSKLQLILLTVAMIN